MNSASTQLSTISTPVEASAPDEGAVQTEGDGAPSGSPATPDPNGTKPDAEAPPAAEPDRNLELSRKLEAAAKREARLRRMDTEWQTRMSDLDTRMAKFEEERKAFEADRDAWNSDPSGFELAKGRDPVEVAKRIARPESEEARRIRKLEEQIKAKEETEQKAREEAETRAQSQAREQLMRKFVGETTPDECPHLTTLYRATDVPNLVKELLNRPADPDDPESPTMLQHFQETHNRVPTDAEIRECLEYEAELRAKEIAEGLSRRRAVPDAQAQPASTQSSQSDSGPSGISNQHGAVTNSAKKPALSLEERRRKAKADLTASLEAQATDRE